jgi:tetratricopeptide (TPR) repeat protein
VQINPASVTAHYNLGNAYIEAGNQGLAIREWIAAVRLDPYAADALNQLGSQLLSAQRYQEAQPYLERAVTVRPEWFYARSNLATVLDVQNKREEAIHQYEKALAIVPPDRRDSIPQIRERIEQLRSNRPDDGDKVLIRKELLK